MDGSQEFRKYQAEQNERNSNLMAMDKAIEEIRKRWQAIHRQTLWLWWIIIAIDLFGCYKIAVWIFWGGSGLVSLLSLGIAIFSTYLLIFFIQIKYQDEESYEKLIKTMEKIRGQL